jgi:hypothetical protein
MMTRSKELSMKRLLIWLALLLPLPCVAQGPAPGIGIDQMPPATLIGDSGLLFGYQPGSGGSGALICSRGWCPVSYTLLQLKNYITGGVINATQINGAAVPASQVCLGSNSGSQLVAGSCGAAPAFGTVLSGSNTNNLIIGGGGSLGFAGGGIINANQINGIVLPTSASLLGTNGGGQIVASTVVTGGTVSLGGNLTTTGGTLTIAAPGNTTMALPSANFTAGYLGLPLTGGAAQTGNYTFALIDSGTMAVMNCGSPCTVTIPANSSIAFPASTTLTILVQPGSSTVTLAITTDTLYWSPSLGTGSRTLPAGSLFSVFKYGTTTWLGAGQGAS